MTERPVVPPTAELLRHAELHGVVTQLETLQQQLRRLRDDYQSLDMHHQTRQALAHVIYATDRLKTVLRHQHLTQGRKV